MEDDTRFTLPFYGFGVDARVWKWFAFRFGARQYVMSASEGSQIQETTEDGGTIVSERLVE